MLKKLALTSVTAVAAAGMMLSAAPANADIENGTGGVLSGNNIPIAICSVNVDLDVISLLNGGSNSGHNDCKGSGQVHQVDQSKR